LQVGFGAAGKYRPAGIGGGWKPPPQYLETPDGVLILSPAGAFMS